MKRTIAAAALAVLALLVLGASGQQPRGTSGTTATAHIMLTPEEATWGAAPPSLPPGAELAVLEGDPSASGPFTMRAKFPDGYTIPPHFHPADEHVTVLQGTFLMGMGDTFSDSALKPLGVSSFAVMPKGARHFAQAKGETIVQIHGIGPWAISYVNPADDPRTVKK